MTPGIMPVRPLPAVHQAWPGSRDVSRRPQVAVPVQVLPPSAPPSPEPSALCMRPNLQLPQDLLCRIQGVVTDMEKSVADERQRSPGPQFACLACNCALTSDASYCDRCGRRQAVAEGPDLVRNLGERLENLQTQREAAEQRAEQLASLRKIVSEGRHQHMTHYLSLSDGGFALRKRDDGSSSNRTESTGSVANEDEQLQRAVSEVEANFASELSTLGASRAEGRLHDRLQVLLKAVLHREQLAEARLKEQREATRNAEMDLKALEESSERVIEDCRKLQARVKELEHHETNSHHHLGRANDLEERLQEHQRHLESSRAREAALKEEMLGTEEAVRRHHMSRKALELESEEMRISLLQRQSEVEDLREQLAEAKESS
ncbi:unnamed protein product [Effrenium voratum]|uniref:Uncharacterized protein n=1 Tax=Effrenium voratum TaxID=2562239 RepID=A0AA36MWL5_9DINO|nr:unnamed protein product [Effrenium voratum]